MDIPALIMQVDTYLTEAIASASQEIVPKSEHMGNESSLDIAVIMDPNDIPSPSLDEFNDLDSVLDFESKEYS